MRKKRISVSKEYGAIVIIELETNSVRLQVAKNGIEEQITIFR